MEEPVFWNAEGTKHSSRFFRVGLSSSSVCNSVGVIINIEFAWISKESLNHWKSVLEYLFPVIGSENTQAELLGRLRSILLHLAYLNITYYRSPLLKAPWYKLTIYIS